jgi:hypothetical protein
MKFPQIQKLTAPAPYRLVGGRLRHLGGRDCNSAACENDRVANGHDTGDWAFWELIQGRRSLYLVGATSVDGKRKEWSVGRTGPHGSA